MLPANWAELAPLLDMLLDAPTEARPALLAKLSVGNADRRRALDELIADCERDVPLLNRLAAERFDALVDEPAQLLPAVLGNRYETGRELGRGGMARVYLARDRKHGRDVAIKVIRPELAASLGHDRFLREIEIAARLRHPNIVPLYDSGEENGTLYFVMPYEEGPSLRDRLREHGALPLSEALSVLRDVARALSYAHEHGVVHRDVKPDNVILSGDAAVVTDFGIAKAVSAALTIEGPTTITQVGSAMGTPAYMAPEQAIGDPATDHRADIYAFGCLAYELCSGAPPFAEGSQHQVIADHMVRVPRPVEELRPEVPVSVATLIARCLAKRPDDRPDTVRELLAALDAVTLTTSASVPGITRKRWSARQWVALPLIALLLGAAGYFTTRQSALPAPFTLAVLPFGNSADDSTMSFVVDGLSDEVAESLTRIPGIQIKSRAGARIYRGQLGVDVAEVGNRLKAAYVMTGVMRQDRERWLLSADIARASDGASIWAKTFIVNPEEQARAVATITESLLQELRKQFADIGGGASLVMSQTSSNEAFALYMKGQERLRRRGVSVKESAELFQRAIAEDSMFARAYSGRSLALALFPYFQGVPAKVVNDDIVHTAQRALALDPSLAQPHVALGLAHQFAFRWDSAAVEFRKAVANDPRDVEALVQYARHLIFRGRVTESMTQLARARLQDPESALVLSWISYAYYLNGQLDSALAESQRALENDPSNFTTISLGAIVNLGAGRKAESRSLNERSPALSTIRPYITAQLGDTAEAQRLLTLMSQTPKSMTLSYAHRAYLHLGLGHIEQAIDAFEKSIDDGEIWPVQYATVDPVHRLLQKHPRWIALLRRIGLRA